MQHFFCDNVTKIAKNDIFPVVFPFMTKTIAANLGFMQIFI